jgi:hypothetical protein
MSTPKTLDGIADRMRTGSHPMTVSTIVLPPHVTEVLTIATRLNSSERLLLAKLLLDSLISDEAQDEADWQNLGLTAFQQEWDNPDDAIYDNWRELYGVPAR